MAAIPTMSRCCAWTRTSGMTFGLCSGAIKTFGTTTCWQTPLNPTSAIPGSAIVSSPHALDLSRRMQDTILTPFCRNRGCASGWDIPITITKAPLGLLRSKPQGDTALAETVKYTTNAFRMGVDYRGLPRTTLSFDELLTYSKVDESVADNNFNFQLANTAPPWTSASFSSAPRPARTRSPMPPPRLPR